MRGALTLLLAGGLAACHGALDHTPADGGAADASPTRSRLPPRPTFDPPGAASYDYVVSLVDVPAESPPGSLVVAGFDLDDHVTADESDPVGCGKVDFTAPARYRGGVGVDAQIARVVELAQMADPAFTPGDDLQEAVTAGQALILMRLREVGDLVEDAEVEVELALGHLADGSAPLLTTVEYLGADRMVPAAGQRLVLDPDAPRGILRGFITGGVVYAGPGSYSLRIPATHDRVLALDFQELYLIAGVAPGTLTDGVIAGYATIDQLLQSIASLQIELPLDETAVRGLLAAQADIDVDPRRPRCEALSLSVVFDAVDCIVDGG